MATTADDTTTTPNADGIAAKFQPQIDKAKAFAKERPWAVGTLLAVLGVATINTLRGRR